MCSADTVRRIIKEEVNEVLKESHETHDQQHADILKLVESHSKSIEAIESNTGQLIELHRDAQAVIRVSSKVGKFVKWTTIPIAGIVLTYEWVQHTISHMSIFK